MDAAKNESLIDAQKRFVEVVKMIVGDEDQDTKAEFFLLVAEGLVGALGLGGVVGLLDTDPSEDAVDDTVIPFAFPKCSPDCESPESCAAGIYQSAAEVFEEAANDIIDNLPDEDEDEDDGRDA